MSWAAVELAHAQDLPTLSVADASADETDDAADQTDAVVDFVVTLSESSSGDVTVRFATSDDTAVAGQDYTAAQGTLTLVSGAVEGTISVSLVDDSLDELAETFDLTLSDAEGATIDDGEATGTIGDDDPEPELIVTMDGLLFTWFLGGYFYEGTDVGAVVDMDAPSGRTVTVDYETAPDQANPAEVGSDYTHVEGTLTFDPGETTRTIAITTHDDEVFEGTEGFSVVFSNSEGATLGRLPWQLVVGDLLMYLDLYMTDDEPVPGVTFESASDVESAGELAFPVTLSGPTEAVEMTYSTSDGTALAGEDYLGVTNATLSFGPGVTAKTVVIELKDDDVEEAATETFSVRLSQTLYPLTSTVGDLEATGSIRDDDGTSRLSIGDASASEGDASVSFTVTLGGRNSDRVTVDYATTDGTAVAGRDYTAAMGKLTFEAGDTHRTITIGVLDDTVHEAVETFTVSLSGADGATLEQVTGTGSIRDDDESPLITIHGSESPERGLMDFVATLSKTSEATISVTYVTDDFEEKDPPAYPLADAEADFVYLEGSLTFAPGDRAKTVRVQILEDEIDEPVEAIVMTMENPVNVRFETREGSDVCPWSGCGGEACCDCGTILDDDVADGLAISDASGPEDAASLEFVVTLSAEASAEVTVDYATSGATATEGEDYEAAAGSLTFPVGTVRRTIEVKPVDDDRIETTETFVVTLSDALGAPLGDSEGTGTIIDNDSPTVSVRDAQGTEDDVGELDFEVTLDQGAAADVTVAYATADGTAVAGSDYTSRRGTLTFQAGQVARTISVPVTPDEAAEDDETFTLMLSNVTGAVIDDGSATGTIRDDDAESATLSIGDAEGSEGDGSLTFVVTLNGERSGEANVSVDYATRDVTAFAGDDYEAAAGSLTFPVGTVRRMIEVKPVDDDRIETTETFVVTLSDALGAPLGDSEGTGTIIDNDSPTVSVRDAQGTEDDVGELDFEVTLDQGAAADVTVAYATADGTAVAGSDYTSRRGTLTFQAGQVARTISVPVTPDEAAEDDETFTLMLSNVTGAVIDDGSATGTIRDDDAESATLSIGDAEGSEGDGSLTFVVTLTGERSGEANVSVDYATRDVTAFAGDDYEAMSGTLTFAPGDSGATLSVSILDDRIDEPDEHFRVVLSAAANATLSAGTATGTIIDDDAGKAPTRGRVWLFEPAADPYRQGFVRVINHSDEAGEVLVEAIDDAGMRLGPVPLSIGAREARHFNSDDLEGGNAAKGLAQGVGPPGTGVWRLELSSELDVEVLSYARTADGFVTSLHDTAPATAGLHRAVFLNPGGNVDQVSRLRLVNPGTTDATVTITGTDDAGGTSAEVVVEVPAGTAREWTAAELERGMGTVGALGYGEGKWRLSISSDRPVVALSLIESPTGNVTNLSTLPGTPGRVDGSHAVPLFPSASDAAGRQGFVRVTNRSSSSVEVRIEAFDNADWEYEAVMLAVGTDAVGAFNSDDMEMGNPDKGLTGSTGAGEGDWWLELTVEEDADLDVGSYVRTTDGFLTAMHDLAPGSEGAYRVVFFNPAENVEQVSSLWLVNRGDMDAAVTITGVDDDGASPGTAVRTTVPAGSARRIESTELESGEAETIDGGALGDGYGKWRLRVDSDQPLMVMSLLENPTGHLTNLSTATHRDDSRTVFGGEPGHP